MHRRPARKWRKLPFHLESSPICILARSENMEDCTNRTEIEPVSGLNPQCCLRRNAGPMMDVSNSEDHYIRTTLDDRQ